MDEKVFCLGWHKTGTTSMHRMLKRLGYEHPSGRKGYALMRNYFKGDYEPIVEFAKSYTCFQDSPWNFPGMYELFDKAFNAKFILTIRDENKWYESLKAWVIKNGGIHKMPYGKALHRFFYDSNNVEKDKQKYLDFYNTHNQNVKDYFGDRLLVFNFEDGDGWEKLCQFLDKPLPDDRQIPHMNKNDQKVPKWEKQGVIFESPVGSHTQCPVVDDLGEVWRIYYSSRDEQGRSNVFYFDVEADNPHNVLDASTEPMFRLGEPGMFDCDGLMPGSIVKTDKDKKLYMMGWNKSSAIPYHLAIGVAIDEGSGFKKCKSPVMDRCWEQPYGTTTPCVWYNEDNKMYRMWFASYSGWEEIDGKMEPNYHIEYANSKDGIHWQYWPEACVRHARKPACYPTVWKEGRVYHMLYCYREMKDYRTDAEAGYNIGLAMSDMGHTNWIVKGPILEKSEDGWDSHMMAYPHIYKDWLFYNGNGFGQTGIGVAKIC